jgi:uncharacterized protein (TIRG00374 family)
MIGYMGNNLLPLRAGEVLRAYVVARRGTNFWTTVTTMVVERVLDGLAVGLMLAAVFFLVPVPRELEWAALLFLSVDLALIAVLGAFTLAPGPVRRIALGLTRRWPRLSARVARVLDTLDTGLAGIRTPSHVPSTVLWSTLIWVTLIATTWTCMLAAHLDLPILAGLTTLAFLGLGVSLPSSPGFVGVIQAASWAALRLFGVPSDDALSFSILLHASQFIPVTLWGLALLFVEHVSLAEAARPHEAPPISTGT